MRPTCLSGTCDEGFREEERKSFTEEISLSVASIILSISSFDRSTFFLTRLLVNNCQDFEKLYSIHLLSITFSKAVKIASLSPDNSLIRLAQSLVSCIFLR